MRSLIPALIIIVLALGTVACDPKKDASPVKEAAPAPPAADVKAGEPAKDVVTPTKKEEKAADVVEAKKTEEKKEGKPAAPDKDKAEKK